MSLPSHTVVIIRIRIPGSLSAPTIPRSKYSDFFSALTSTTAGKLSVRDEELELNTDVAQFERDLRQILAKKQSPTPLSLAIEVLDADVDIRAYDDLCEGLSLILRGKTGMRVARILVSVSNGDLLKTSLWLQKQLLPACRPKHIPILIAHSRTGLVELLENGETQSPKSPLPRLLDPPSLASSRRDLAAAPEEIVSAIRILFGNFAVRVHSKEWHVPAIMSLQNFTRDERLIARLRFDASELLGSLDFSILPFGLKLGGIETLALAVAETDSNRLVRLGDPTNGKPTLILCDFLSDLHPILEAIETLARRSSSRVAIIALARFADAPEFPSVPSKSYLTTRYRIAGTAPENCSFCSQGTECLPGETLGDFETAVRTFDSRTFWDLVSQDASYFNVGHWQGERTPNHYQFRIMSEPIFRSHGYGLALRVRNVLADKNILHSWVKKIVCVEGEEASAFATHIAGALSLRPEAVVRIPRPALRKLSGRFSREETMKLLREHFPQDVLDRDNVLIIDQAAHHFRTLSSVRQICEAFECTVLGFVVFVDRTEAGFSLGEYLHDSHYISLYSWPCPPRMGYECPCMTIRASVQ